MSTPKPQPYLEGVSVYQPGKRKLAGEKKTIKLSSNENPRGPSPAAIEAYQRAAQQLSRYPEDGALTLRKALAAHHGFAPDQIICGAGSDDIIRMLCHAYGGPGRRVLYSAHGFAMYQIYAHMSGAEAITVAEQNLTADVDAIIDAAQDERVSLVFLANPNNPTGSYLTKNELQRLRDGLREEVILVLDGAYAEYMHADDYSDGREFIDQNTVLMRTFSKAYGLATLRIGWGVGPKSIIDALYKVRSPFNLTQPSLEAALAALADQDYLAQHVNENNTERARLESAISDMGFAVQPCHANFVLVRFDDASTANAHLASRGLIVREIENYGLPDYLRISIGTPKENDALLTALKGFAA